MSISLKSEHFMSLRDEAAELARQTGLKKQAVLRWMENVGIRGVPDLMQRYPNAEYAEAIWLAGQDIEDFIIDSFT